MKKIMTRAELSLGVAVIALAAGLVGCTNNSQPITDTIPTAEMQSRGAKMQQEGIMSQNDYVRIDGLAHQVSQTHAISDADLDWTVAHLSTQNNSIARARSFNTLSYIRPMSAAQQEKIRPVIAPYLTSTDKLDQLGAQRVQKAMQASS